MRKILSILLITVILLCGCTQGAAQQNYDTMSEESADAYEVYGKIRSASGNEIVLAIGELPDSGGWGGNRASGESGTADGEMPNRTSGGNNMSDGSMPDRASGERGTAGETRTFSRGAAGGMAGGISLAYTGEDRTYIIPVTAEVTMGSGENIRELRFTQLAYKNIVKLTLTGDGVITAVQVLS